MPLYEYRCRDCDHGFELLVREATTFECPACHGQQLEKQLVGVRRLGAGGARRARADGGRAVRLVRTSRRPGFVLGELSPRRTL